MKRDREGMMTTHETIWGYIFISPWLIGLLLFWVGPVGSVFQMSFTDNNILQSTSFVGIRNYLQILGSDQLFWESIKNTLLYVILRVPLIMAIGFLIAVLLNKTCKGITFFRALIYFPSILPVVAAGALWMLLLNPDLGWIPSWMEIIGLPKTNLLGDLVTVKPTLVLISLWQIGSYMVIFLSNLQNVPSHLYESASIDGAGSIKRLLHITIPMMSPTFLYVMIVDIIASFQVFSLAFILTNGGPGSSTLFYILYLYRQAFTFFQMGYASAMAVLLFLVMIVLTVIMMKTSKRWVHYERM